MNKYLIQLHEDLAAAHRPEELSDDEFGVENPSIEASLEEAERFVSGEIPMKKFGDTCGIQKIQFPPAEKLTENQLLQLCDSIDELMWSWFVDITLPESLPITKRYQFLVEVFDTEVMLVENGHVGIELCEYEASTCIFGEHCMCVVDEDELKELEEYEEEEELDELISLFLIYLDDKIALNSEKLPLTYREDASPILESEKKTRQTLAEWLNISLESFPDTSKLKPSTVGKITNILLRIWDPTEDLVFIFNQLEPHLRLERLLEYFRCEIWFDSLGIMYFVPQPNPKIINPLDKLLENNNQLFKDIMGKERDEEDEEADDDDIELPF